MHVALAALLALFSGLVQERNLGGQDSSRAAITFAEAPFALPTALRDSIRFGYLTVPQDHDNPAAGTFRLAFAILPSAASLPARDPIVFIPGGPGMSVIEPWTAEAARADRIHLLREHRDFIIFEPRGHGLSEPHTCPELNGAAPSVTTSMPGEAALARALQTCRSAMVAAGIRLETLNSVQSARDLELLRRALGAPALNLLGVSYGSRIAAEAMRIVPEAIRSVALIGPLPAAHPRQVNDPAVARARLNALFERCREQPRCFAAFPDLLADFDTVLARARRMPFTLPMPRTPQIPDGHIVLDDTALVEAIAGLLFERRLAASAPLLINTLATRGLDPLVPLAPGILSAIDNRAESYGVFLSFNCNDAPAVADSAAWFRARCTAWLGEEFGDLRAEPVRSDIPALVMAGEFDPRTPPEYSRLVADGLTRAHVFEIPWHGHEYGLACVNRIERDFFESPDRVPDSGCLDSLPPLIFASQVVPSRWTSGISMRAATAPLGVAGTAGAALLLLVLSGVWVLATELRRNHQALGGFRSESIALLLAAIIGVVFVVATVGALVAGSREGIVVPALGVPRSWKWVLVLPWLLGVAGIMSALVVVSRLRSGEPKAARRATVVLAGIVLLLATVALA